MSATEESQHTPPNPPPDLGDSVITIHATILPKAGTGYGYREVRLDPDYAVLKSRGEERKVIWRFYNIPKDHTPTIVPLAFISKVQADGTVQAFLRPFKDLVLDEETITGRLYPSVAGVCRYEVVLEPRVNAKNAKRRRLYCTTSEMGGIEIEPPPS